MIFRPATPTDAYALAELSIMGGDGMYEFLLEELAPKEMLAGLMARTMKQDSGGYCWRHCFVAEEQGLAGMINAYPAAWLRNEERDVLPSDRVQVLDPIDQAQDWDSFLINSVAVRPQHRRKGVGLHLVEWAIEQAKGGNFPQTTANVWQDNEPAVGLFTKAGFNLSNQVEVPLHPMLKHVGGSLLMTRRNG
jgi:ribosomal protein S18 acetylase RimI-like enzyme